ncbi:MAG TPA: response regulator transcription factor [Solirubrobacteraceae bacterium]|jgi:DNA-binding NarL/FixJ family response regulator|nr:response regulator transcription factor [Solirubrobacteraceae bacterium]
MDDLARVLIADADQVQRDTLARLLTKAGFRVLQAEAGDQALALARSGTPEAVILEVPLATLSGYEVCHTLRSEFGTELPIMFLSGMRTESYDRVAGLLLGADDYLVKPYAEGELIARLTNLIRRSRTHALGEARRLTKRELEVLDLLGEGLRHEDIARRLFISPKTVATHVEHILRKLGVRSRAEAIAVAYREEILQPHGSGEHPGVLRGSGGRP